MKKKIIIVLVAFIIGAIASYYLFNRVLKTTDNEYVTCKAFQIGAFTNYDNAYKVAERNNGIVISDKDIYRVYVAILTNEEAVNNLKKYYESIGLNYYIRTITVSKDFATGISLSEELLNKSSNEAYNSINMSILKKYEELI